MLPKTMAWTFTAVPHHSGISCSCLAASQHESCFTGFLALPVPCRSYVLWTARKHFWRGYLFSWDLQMPGDAPNHQHRTRHPKYIVRNFEFCTQATPISPCICGSTLGCYCCILPFHVNLGNTGPRCSKAICNGSAKKLTVWKGTSLLQASGR